MSTGPSENSWRLLSPRIDRVKAGHLLGKRRLLSLGRCHPVRLELVYLPVYRVDAAIVDPDVGRSSKVAIAVDAIGGGVSRLDRGVDLRPDPEPPRGELFPRRIDVEQAIDRVRIEMPWILLPVSLKQNRRLPVETLEFVERLGYPYWIQHLRRRRRYDFEALDGFSGTRVGPRLKATIVGAFLGESG